MALRKGQNPREVLPHHEERGPDVVGWYTYADIARLTGVKEGTIRVHVSRGKLDPRSLESVILYYIEQVSKTL